MTPLQAPTQAAPSGVAVTASSVSSPNSAPNVPTTTASSVTSPNASVSSPSVISSVSSPSASSSPSSSPSSVSSVTPPVSSVKPVGTNTVKPLGTYDPQTGKCVKADWGGEQCDSSESLEQQASDLADKVANGTGSYSDKVELEKIRAQLNLRSLFGNDKAADMEYKSILKSDLYQLDIKGNGINGISGAQLKFWQTLNKSMNDGIVGVDDIKALGRFMNNYRLGIDDAGRPYFYNVRGGGPESPMQQIDIPGNSSRIFINGDENLLNSVFKGSSAETILGFFATSLNGLSYTSPNYSPGNPLTGVSGVPILGMSYANFKVNEQKSKQLGRPSSNFTNANPCDVKLDQPHGDRFTVQTVNSVVNRDMTTPQIFDAIPPLPIHVWIDNFASTTELATFDVSQILGKRFENYGNFLVGVGASITGTNLTLVNSLAGGASFPDGTWKNGSAYALYYGFNEPRDAFWTKRGYDYQRAGCNTVR